MAAKTSDPGPAPPVAQRDARDFVAAIGKVKQQATYAFAICAVLFAILMLAGRATPSAEKFGLLVAFSALVLAVFALLLALNVIEAMAVQVQQAEAARAEASEAAQRLERVLAVIPLALAAPRAMTTSYSIFGASGCHPFCSDRHQSSTAQD
jgi:hypothetical protein